MSGSLKFRPNYENVSLYYNIIISMKQLRCTTSESNVYLKT